MDQESRIEQIFEALRKKVPIAQIHEAMDKPQVASVYDMDKPDIEKKVIGVLSGLQIVESVEIPVVYGNKKEKNEPDLIVKTKRNDDGPGASLIIIIRPGRGGIRRYRRLFGNTYNLDPDQIDEYLKIKKIVLIRGSANKTNIEKGFLGQLKGIQEHKTS